MFGNLQKGTLGLFPQRPSILKLSTLCYWNNFKRSNYSSNCVFLNKLHDKWCTNQYMMKPVLHLSLSMIYNKFKCIIMLSKPVKRIEYLELVALEKDEGKWNKYSSVWQGADLEMEFEIEEMVLGKKVSSERTDGLIHKKHIQVFLNMQFFWWDLQLSSFNCIVLETLLHCLCLGSRRVAEKWIFPVGNEL